MNTNKRNFVYGIVVLIFLMGVVLGSPVFPSLIACEGDYHVFDNESSKCENCYVQIIETGQDEEINPPNREGEPTGDDTLIKETSTGDEDFYLGKFTAPVSVTKGDNIYARVWDSHETGDSEYFGESEVIYIEEAGERHFFEDIYLDKKYREKEYDFFIGCKNNTSKIKDKNITYTISPENNDSFMDRFYVDIGEFTENITYNVSITNKSEEIISFSEKGKKWIDFSWNGKANKEYIGDGIYNVSLKIEKYSDEIPIKEQRFKIGKIKIDNTPPKFNISYDHLNLTKRNSLNLNFSFSEDTFFWSAFNKTSNKSSLNASWKYNNSLKRDVISIGNFYNSTSEDWIGEPNSTGYENIKTCSEKNNKSLNKTRLELIENQTLIKKINNKEYNLTINAFDKLGNKKQKSLIVKREVPINKSVLVRFIENNSEINRKRFVISNNKVKINNTDSNLSLKMRLRNNLNKGQINITQYRENPVEKDIEGKELTEKFFEISEGKNIEDNIVNISLKIKYSDKDIESIKKESMKIYYYNKSLGEWEKIQSRVNTEDNIIIANTSHPGFFGVFGDKKENEEDSENGGGSEKKKTYSSSVGQNENSKDSTEEPNNKTKEEMVFAETNKTNQESRLKPTGQATLDLVMDNKIVSIIVSILIISGVLFLFFKK